MFETTVIRNKRLASMLAEENLSVNFSRTAKTAYFDPKRRSLILPMWKSDNPAMVDALIVHEVGHALHSDGLNDALMNATGGFRGYINIMEDCRVDRLQRERYPGTKKDYYEGYKALLEMGIFGIDKTPIDKMLLADRINLHSKIGQYIMVPFFNEEEKALLKKAFSTETCEEVLEVARLVEEYDRNHPPKTSNEEGSSGTGGEEGNGEVEYVKVEKVEEGDEEDVGDSNGFSSLGEDGDEVVVEGEEGDGNTSSADSEKTKDGKGGGEETTEGSSNDTKDATSTDDSKSIEEASSTNANTNNSPCPLTADSVNEWAENNALAETYNRYSSDTQHYITIGDVDPNVCLGDGVEWRRLCTERVAQYINGNDYPNKGMVKEVEKELAPAVAGLQKEFAIWKQAQVSCSVRNNRGTIDVNRLHLHRVNDNIFTRSIINNRRDTNHRIVFLLDISSSMLKEPSLTMLMNQMLIFRRFCLREKIAFNLITYTSMNVVHTVADDDRTNWLSRYQEARGFLLDKSERDTYWAKRYNPNMGWANNHERAVLVDILNENDSDDWFNTLYMFMTKVCLYCRTEWWNPMLTPTNEALSLLYSWMNGLKKTMREDKLNLVVLTDGESTDYRGCNEVVKDAIGKVEMGIDDLVKPAMEGIDDPNGLQALALRHDKFYVAFLILKAMKDNGIVNGISWYNLCHTIGDATRCDLLYLCRARFMKAIGKDVNLFDGPIRVRLKGLSALFKSEGMIKVNNILPWIDSFIIYIPVRTFAYMAEPSRRFKNNDKLVTEDFKAKGRVRGIMKTLAAAIAKTMA